MSIKDKIINSIKNKLYDKFTNKDSNNKYVEKFIKLLSDNNIDINLIDLLSKKFSSNIESITLNNGINDEIIDDIIAITVYSYFESIIIDKNLFYKKIIVYGAPGSGKTSFIASLIKKHEYKEIDFFSHNNESIELLNLYSKNVKINNYCEYDNNKNISILEVSNYDELINIIDKESNAKLFILIDSQSSISKIYNIKDQLSRIKFKSEGIIISKKDFIGSITTCMSVSHILNLKIIAITNKEIADNQRAILSPYSLINVISLKLFNKENDIDDVRKILSNNLDMINMDIYKMYISFMINVDFSKYEKIINMFDFALKKFNINKNILQNAFNKIQEENNKVEVIVEFKKQINIINSMRKCEKKNPEIIDIKRAKRIAIGSGSSVNEVFNLINKFEHTKKSIKFMNYSNIFKDLNKK